MVIIEAIKDAINTYLENNNIDGYCRAVGSDLIIWLNGSINRDVLELAIQQYSEVTTYSIDMLNNKVIYNYV